MEAFELVAALMLVALIAYGVLAGADFGGGVWDLLASGARLREQRTAIARALAPVWEANHVWLIFVIVLLFTGFPGAFYALNVALFVPFHLVLVGITLRGAAFVLRAYGPQTPGLTRRWGAVFGAASVITPPLLGMSVGAVSAGNIRVAGEGIRIVGIAPWLAPVSLAMGALALATCAYLAAVYLTNETAGDLQEDFRRRALWSGTFVVVISALTIPLTYLFAHHLWRGLTSARALPLIAAGVIAALVSGAALLFRAYRVARIATIAQVTFVLAGWGVAQFPYLIYPDFTLRAASAPHGTLMFVLYTLPFGAALLGPSLWWLFRVFKSSTATSHDEH